MDVQGLNKCLRGELSAVETYRQALDKSRDQYGTDAKFAQLSQMCRDHEDAAARLRDLITRLGGNASNDSGAWGTWSKTVMGTAKLFGDKAALKALKEGEESGLKDYEDAMRQGAAQDVAGALAPIVATEREHVRQLDRMMETM